MIKRPAILLMPCLVMAAALTACQPSANAPPAVDETPATPASPATEPTGSPAGDGPVAGAIVSAAELVGEYRIPGVDGQDIDLPHGISATIDDTTIRVSADCVKFAWSYRFEGVRLVTETAPVVTCERGLLPEEEAVQAAFEAAEAVRRLPSNGIEFSGGGRSVILFSQ